MSEEAQLYPLPRILAEDFAEFAAMLVNDEDFSSSHAAWERLAEARRNELSDDGYMAKFIDVRPAGFMRFVTDCRWAQREYPGSLRRVPGSV